MYVIPEWMQCVTQQPNNMENPIYVVTMRGHALFLAVNVPNKCTNKLIPYAVKYAYMMRGFKTIKINRKLLVTMSICVEIYQNL